MVRFYFPGEPGHERLRSSGSYRPTVKTVSPYPRRSSPCGLSTQAGWTTPPLRSSSITEPSSLLRTAPPLCRVSVLSPREYLSLVLLPSHRDDRFPRSSPKPGSRSRRLHAGRQLGSKQISPNLIPSAVTCAGFDVI